MSDFLLVQFLFLPVTTGIADGQLRCSVHDATSHTCACQRTRTLRQSSNLEFSDLLRRRLYEVRTASLGFVEAEASIIQAAMDKLREAARSPISADPITDPISAEDSQLYHERTRENSEGSEAEDASVEASWLVDQSNSSISSIDFVPATIQNDKNDQT